MKHNLDHHVTRLLISHLKNVLEYVYSVECASQEKLNKVPQSTICFPSNLSASSLRHTKVTLLEKRTVSQLFKLSKKSMIFLFHRMSKTSGERAFVIADMLESVMVRRVYTTSSQSIPLSIFKMMILQSERSILKLKQDQIKMNQAAQNKTQLSEKKPHVVVSIVIRTHLVSLVDIQLLPLSLTVKDTTFLIFKVTNSCFSS